MVTRLSIDPVTWDSVVAVGLFLVAAAPPFSFWAIKRMRLRTMFRPEYQPTEDTSTFSHTEEASKQPQRIPATLRLALNTHVEFISLEFEGHGTMPAITSLDDWQLGKGITGPRIKAYPLRPAHPRWYWEYESPHHRLRNSRITIGVDYVATGYFVGHLVFRMTASDGVREQRLPFTIRQQSTL